MADRLRIIKGADKQAVIRLKHKNGDPVDLTDLVSIQVILETKDRAKITFSNLTMPASKAQATIKLGPMSYIFTAVNAGRSGNAITLNFNGIDDVATVVGAWNTANPSNTVITTAPVDTVIPSQSIRLSGAFDNYKPVDVFGDAKLGKVSVTMLEKETINLRSGVNQSVKIVIDLGTDPASNKIIGYFENKVDVVGD